MEVNINDLFKSKEANILPCIVLKENCKFELNKVVHEEFLDLILYYKLCSNLTASEKFTKSMLVSNVFLKEVLQISDFAFKNMVNIFTKNQYLIKPLNQEIKQLLDFELLDSALFNKQMLETPMDFPVFIVTNNIKLQGASVLYYPFVFSDLAKKLKDDLFIIPSSVHEVLAVPYSLCDYQELFDMVKGINDSIVGEEDFLKTGLYQYIRKSNEIIIVEN